MSQPFPAWQESGPPDWSMASWSHVAYYLLTRAQQLTLLELFCTPAPTASVCKQGYEVGIVVLMLQMSKWGHRVAKQLTRYFPASKWQTRAPVAFNSGLCYLSRRCQASQLERVSPSTASYALQVAFSTSYPRENKPELHVKTWANLMSDVKHGVV